MSEFEILMLRAIDLATSRGARYADMRVVHRVEQGLMVKNGVVKAVQSGDSLGFGVRVLVGNAWGFASSRELSAAEVERITRLALEIAAASAAAHDAAVDLGPAVTSRGRYATPLKIDPFEVSLDEKLRVLLAADAVIAKTAGIRTRIGSLAFQREDKWFANSEGAFTEQTLVESGGGLQAIAVGEGEVPTRSFPNSFGRSQVTAGWEAILAWDLPGQAARVAEEALALLTAAPCPAEINTTIILGGDQLALQIHESCGHATELDRVFGSEAAYAGTSFLTTDKLGTFHYGSPLVNLTADSIRPLGLGTFGWDDEGVAAQSTPLVKEGLFVNYLMSRESAARLGRVSNGCMRASEWNRMPIIRMTNISIEPGEWELEDLIADTEDGIYMETNRSWSIDDKRYNFQFGTELGYEIKGGKRTRLLRNPTYTSVTPQFWNSCDAVCNANHWQMYGTPNCGKGQPSQVAHTGHGAAPARFRNIRVGVLKS
jgi:TldD protein